MNTRAEQLKGQSSVLRGLVQRGGQVAIGLLIQGLVLFLAAGRLDWLMAWVYCTVYVVTVLVNMAIVLPKDPGFVAERGKVKEDTKGWDKVVTSLVGVAQLLALVVAGLDVRWGWSPPLEMVISLAALLVMALGYALFSWAMLSNQFFTTTVRIQEDRGHAVATGGPYRWVRHPGYVAYSLILVATPPMLGSLWAFVPALAAVGLFIVRTALEDKTLQEELVGYKEYSQRVRYRLLPGIW